jgi:nucleotide-binding universal stress UspA family protein
MLVIRTILHPTDFSERSATAFHLACSLARDHHACLLVLHVYPPPASHGEAVARRQPNGHEGVLREELRRIQPPDPKVAVEHRLEEGEAADQILRVARESGCGLIVMGTHGRTGLRRVLMGSVAEEILRLAPCPVLTVNSPFPQEAPELRTQP